MHAICTPVEAKFVSIFLNLWTENMVIPYVEVHAAVVEGSYKEVKLIRKFLTG